MTGDTRTKHHSQQTILEGKNIFVGVYFIDDRLAKKTTYSECVTSNSFAANDLKQIQPREET